MAKPIFVMTGQKDLDRAMRALRIENPQRKRVIVTAARNSLKKKDTETSKKQDTKENRTVEKKYQSFVNHKIKNVYWCEGICWNANKR